MDASVLIGLAKVGALSVLDAVPYMVWTTETVLEEVLSDEHPEGQSIERAIQEGWIQASKTQEQVQGRPGLGRGELSILSMSDSQDLLVLDDRPARRQAEALEQPYTGTLGLVVAAAQEGWIPKRRARDVLEKLAESDFRMSVELYRACKAKIEDKRGPEHT